MDIRNNKNIFHSKIKPFTLKATASAILALNAEAVSAAPCPAEIFGTLAGICEFTATASVTVENGGTVGGILMDGQTPSNSFIAINTGGTVSDVTGIGIDIINSSSLTNGLSNNGTISNTSGKGIVSRLSNISGGVSNSGLISIGATGITVDQGTITGNILNTGTIISNTQGTGILLTSSLINGGISNSGTISGSLDDSGITITHHTTINGDITNSGLLSAVGGNALLITNSTLAGEISNTNRIESTTGGGIGVMNVSFVQSNIINTGIINAGSQGIDVRSRSTINGGISNSGTINGGVAGMYINTSAVKRGITNSGTISGDATGIHILFSSAIITGGISNSGMISGGATGISISDNATVNGGLSNSGTIQGVNAINISNSTVGNIDILGETARIIGAVSATSTAVNITNGAVFTSEGTYDVLSFNVAQNAVFNMDNTVTVANGFNNSGTLAITDGVQTIAGPGTYTQNTGGTFQTTVLSAANYGQLSVAGTADLSNSGDIYVQTQQNTTLHTGDVLSNVINGATFSVPTNGFNVSTNSFIWNFTASMNNLNTGVNLNVAINPAAYNVCQGAYCQGALNTILGQVAAGNSLFDAYNTLSTATAVQTAASQATPELTNENIQIIQLITRAVVDIVPMWSSLRGKSAGDATLYQPGKIWVKPYGASMTQNARNTVNGFDATAYGAVIGKDTELSNDWLFGGAFAVGGDNMQGKSVLSSQSINSTAYQGMLYGAKRFPDQFYVAGQGLVGYEINNTSRSIPLYASTAKGSYNSWFTNIRAEAGWSTSVLSPAFVVTPEVDASYVFINQGSYQESGSVMDLSVATNNNSSLVFGAYGNAAYHLRNTKHQNDLTFNGYAGLADDVLNNQPQTISTFVAGGSSFSTFGVQFNGLVFRGGAGLTVTNPTKPFILELNYDVQAGNNAYSGIGAATIKYKA